MKANTEFERFTQRVFQKLERNGFFWKFRVLHNVKLKGKAGCDLSSRSSASGTIKLFMRKPSNKRTGGSSKLVHPRRYKYSNFI